MQAVENNMNGVLFRMDHLLQKYRDIKSKTEISTQEIIDIVKQIVLFDNVLIIGYKNRKRMCTCTNLYSQSHITGNNQLIQV